MKSKLLNITILKELFDISGNTHISFTCWELDGKKNTTSLETIS